MRIWLAALAVPALALLLAAAPSTPTDAVKATWLRLPASANKCGDEVFDYFPDGGLRILWCHARDTLTGVQVAELAGTPIWASGPHKKGVALDLTNHATFGHYDPAFVKKLPQIAVPGATDPKFREATQATYDAVLKSRARNAWAVHEKLSKDTACAKRERDAYVANMKSERPNEGYYERWYDFLTPPFCSGGEEEGHGTAETPFDGNVTKTLTGFWLRRQLDGTEAHWVEALRTVLQTYDASWLAKREARGKAKR
jgi:hypothetical protein